MPDSSTAAKAESTSVPILDDTVKLERGPVTGKTAAELLADARARHPELSDDAELLDVTRNEAKGDVEVGVLDVMRTRGYGLVTRPEPPRTAIDGIADAEKLASQLKDNADVGKLAKQNSETQAKADTDRAEREQEVAAGIAAVKAEQEVAVTEAAIEREARLNPDGDSSEVKAGKAKAAKS